MPIIFVSAYTDDAALRDDVYDEHVEFLQKPFTSRALVNRVREVLDRESNRNI